MLPSNLEWLNSNSLRSYPVTDTSNCADNSGTVTLPDYLIVDALFTVPAGSIKYITLKSLTYAGDVVILTFGSDTVDTVGSVTIDTKVHTLNTAYTINGTPEASELVGKIVIGTVDILKENIPFGVFQFSDIKLEPTVVRPDIRGIQGISVVQPNGLLSELITGNVKLIQGTNITLTYIAPIADEEPSIRIDAVPSASELEEECLCSSSNIKKPAITSVNGVEPDGLGNINIVSGSSCLDITVDGTDLIFNDECSTPCCGCSELELITSTLEQLRAAVEKVETRAATLSSEATNFHSNVLGSFSI